MNIALFASAFHPSLGGVEELCRQLALELMRQGHGVIVLTNRWPRDLPADETIDGISVYRLPFRLPEGSAKAAINYHLTHRGIENEMLSILRKHQINMLHVQCVSSNAHYAMIAQERLGLPLVVTLQGELTMDANQIFQKSPQAQRILRRALDQAQVITGCSAKTLRDGEEFYGKPFGQRGRVIFNGVNLEDFGPSMGNDQRSMSNTEGTAEPQITQISQINNGKKPEVRSSKLEGNMDAAPIESEALPKPAAAVPARRDNSYLLTPRCSPEGGSYIFALGRMARQKGFDVLLRAYALVADGGLPQRHQDTKDEGIRLATAGKPASLLADTFDSRRAGTATDYSANTDNTANTDHTECTDKTEKASVSSATFVVSNSLVSPVPISGAYESLSGCLRGEKDSAPSAAIPSLIIAGDGPELDNLKSLARELGIAGQVEFPGRADHAAVVRYMKGCELFVLSSRADEGLPVVCAEAMGAGCAIVATRSGGAPEAVLDGQTGLLVDRENIEQLSAAMQRMIADPALRKQLAAAGKARASEFAWPKITQQYLDAYADSAAGRAGQGSYCGRGA